VTEIVARLAVEQGLAVTPQRATQLAAIGRRLSDTTRAAADGQAILADPATYLHTLASLRQDDAV
jgi:hypothetical protein